MDVPVGGGTGDARDVTDYSWRLDDVGSNRSGHRETIGGLTSVNHTCHRTLPTAADYRAALPQLRRQLSAGVAPVVIVCSLNHCFANRPTRAKEPSPSNVRSATPLSSRKARSKRRQILLGNQFPATSKGCKTNIPFWRTISVLDDLQASGPVVICAANSHLCAETEGGCVNWRLNPLGRRRTRCRMSLFVAGCHPHQRAHECGRSLTLLRASLAK